MTYIGIDHGTKRVGISTSDIGETIAFPSVVLRNNSKLIEELKKIAKEKSVKEFVIGESKNYKGTDNLIMKDIYKLKSQLENEGFVVHLEPEFMSSAEAMHLQDKNEMLDASAATIILQSFLNKKRQQNRQ